MTFKEFMLERVEIPRKEIVFTVLALIVLAISVALLIFI
jgi:hypothetical protein